MARRLTPKTVAELVSASNPQPATPLLVATWMLKQVQHDGGKKKTDFLKAIDRP
ncbi:hypothetical protein [Sphingomonas hengshuiensis]|uniref:hypothetical protein n=1 Tax=Sphingomonas hengshuiensis TaxID=1609977 RepID=UPI0012B8C34C|nr:hypothetical protein [Sphingomonas hengshuiensis]